MIINSVKQQIVEAAKKYMEDNQLGQDAFARHVSKMNGGTGFSVAYLNDMLKGKTVTGGKNTPIDDKYFLRIAKAINLKVGKSYRFHHNTDNYAMCMNTFEDARNSCLPHGIDGGTGGGKSYAAEDYRRLKPRNTYYVRCHGDLTAKSFFLEIAYSLNISVDGAIYSIRKNVINKLKNEDNPLLIVDEAENLKDRAWDSMKAIMDDVKGYAGIVFIGANNFEATLEKKATKMKACFPQVLRRIREGGFAHLFTLTQDEVTDVAKPYGITKQSHLKALFDTCRNMGELTAMLEKIMREHDETKTSVDDLIELYCNVQRKLRAAA